MRTSPAFQRMAMQLLNDCEQGQIVKSRWCFWLCNIRVILFNPYIIKNKYHIETTKSIHLKSEPTTFFVS